MSLESLANELLLDLFEYFPAVQLLRAFHCLNARFDHLILIHFQTYRLDFQAASKQDFDIICRVNLPVIAGQIISFGLSDDDETPNQMHLFRSYGWNLRQFESLRSLSFDHIRSGEIITEILLECPHLTRLNLTACYFGCKQNDILHFMNTIWSLPQLTHCYLDIDFKYGLYIPTPTNFSLSMKHLSIVGVPYRIGQLTDLYKHTSCLRYLALDLFRIRDDEGLQTPIPSLVQVNLVFMGPQDGIIENLLQHMPNLCRLKIETCFVEMNGYEWERIIRNHLLNLKVFQLKMRFQVVGEENKKELLKSFRTRFWLDEHQWFIRYHYNLQDSSNMICLYTLPYRFTYLDILFPVLSQSTCPNEDDYRSYNHVQHLLYRSSPIEEMIVSNLNFPRIKRLSVKFPVNPHLWSIIEKRDCLTSLEISRSNTDAQSQLQTLLDHVSHLYSLKFNSWPEIQPLSEGVIPIIMKSRPIRQLNLLGYDRWFDDEECVQLSCSPLGTHCQILFIKVKNRTNILSLINTIHNLRALIVRSEDDNWINYSLSTEDQLVQWLQQSLPSTCSIQRDSRFVHHIRIWIYL